MFSNLIALTGDATSAQGGGGLLMLIPIVLMVVLMYFMLIRPQNKKRKAEEKMRKSLQVGDEITTIGGIVGKIVSIKEDTDTIVIETGADRSKMRIKKWAIGSCDTVHEEPAE